jgi:hypothetical protein
MKRELYFLVGRESERANSLGEERIAQQHPAIEWIVLRRIAETVALEEELQKLTHSMSQVHVSRFFTAFLGFR